MLDNENCLREAGRSGCGTPEALATPHAHGAICATCGQAGTRVEGQTIKALLAVSLRVVQPTEYRFCRTATCPVVYFTADGSTQHVTIDHVRERVYQKEPEAADVLVCYCFRHTVGAVREAPDPATVVADITRGIQAGQCACDLRNPQGSCCLGNVRALIQHARRSG